MGFIARAYTPHGHSRRPSSLIPVVEQADSRSGPGTYGDNSFDSLQESLTKDDMKPETCGLRDKWRLKSFSDIVSKIGSTYWNSTSIHDSHRTHLPGKAPTLRNLIKRRIKSPNNWPSAPPEDIGVNANNCHVTTDLKRKGNAHDHVSGQKKARLQNLGTLQGWKYSALSPNSGTSNDNPKYEVHLSSLPPQRVAPGINDTEIYIKQEDQPDVPLSREPPRKHQSTKPPIINLPVISRECKELPELPQEHRLAVPLRHTRIPDQLHISKCNSNEDIISPYSMSSFSSSHSQSIGPVTSLSLAAHNYHPKPGSSHPKPESRRPPGLLDLPRHEDVQPLTTEFNNDIFQDESLLPEPIRIVHSRHCRSGSTEERRQLESHNMSSEPEDIKMNYDPFQSSPALNTRTKPYEADASIRNNTKLVRKGYQFPSPPPASSPPHSPFTRTWPITPQFQAFPLPESDSPDYDFIPSSSLTASRLRDLTIEHHRQERRHRRNALIRERTLERRVSKVERNNRVLVDMVKDVADALTASGAKQLRLGLRLRRDLEEKEGNNHDNDNNGDNNDGSDGYEMESD
ncbi:hypothetical protein F5884DRAFT_854852 [Xylogone sp. PMI_703]|nr:hypothetical protein F5884DRAFT_854852 [Xylogone sp. PMI_703]